MFSSRYVRHSRLLSNGEKQKETGKPRQAQGSRDKVITDGHVPVATVGLYTIIDFRPEIISFDKQPAIVAVRSLNRAIAREYILYIAIFLAPGSQQPECCRLVWRR